MGVQAAACAALQAQLDAVFLSCLLLPETMSALCRWGMLIAVLARQHQDFKGFLLFYEQFLNQKGLMSWQLCRTSGPVYVNPENGGCNAATDGDLDAAYALLLAGELPTGSLPGSPCAQLHFCMQVQVHNMSCMSSASDQCFCVTRAGVAWGRIPPEGPAYLQRTVGVLHQ